MAKVFGEGFEYGEIKTKLPQPATVNAVQNRDLFQTPRYAVDLLVPLIPKDFTWVWEPAAGEGRIVRRLKEKGYKVVGTDLRGIVPVNFIEGILFPVTPVEVIITNPPFSLKKQFYERCMKYGIPFALLIPADYSRWIIKATQEGAEKIIPTRRIDYLTPNVVARVNDGEGTEYKNIDEIPQTLLYNYSSSDFHSMWLTWGFNLGRTETFVDLPIKEKKENI